MENTSGLTELEQEARIALPAADEIADLFPLQRNPQPATPSEHAQRMEKLAFGSVFSDHMAHAVWHSDNGWAERSIKAYGPVSLDPAAVVFHYGQEVFEGIKAYHHADGSVWTFRPGYNAARLRASARRLAMPELSTEDFLASLVGLVRADKRWVPQTPGASLYLRPFMIASEPFLGVDSAGVVDYFAIASPSGSYFKNGFAGVSIWVTRDYHRAGPGGTGAAKCGGNYAASLLPQQQAKEKGCQQVCFLDVTSTYLEELGGMNLFLVRKDGTVLTPALTGTILEGGTRSAIIQLLQDKGVKVEQRQIALTEAVDGIQAGEISELFACGTAAVVTPITRFAGEGFDLNLEVGQLASEIYRELTGIQNGEVEDRFNWMYRLA